VQPEVQPEVQPGVIPLRPLGLGDIISGAFGAISRNWQLVFAVSFVLAVITQILTVPLTWLAVKDLPLIEPDAVPTAEQLGGVLTTVFASAGIAFGGSIVMTAVLTAVMTMVVSRAVLGVRAEAADIWRQSAPRILPVLGQGLLVLAILFAPALFVGLVVGAVATSGAGPGLFVLLGLPALALMIYLDVAFIFGSSAVVLETASPVAGLRRSRALIRDNWWRTFGIYALAIVITIIVAAIIQLPLRMALGTALEPAAPLTLSGLAWDGVGTAIATALTTPFTVAVTVLLYHDMRFRKEDLHRQILANLPSNR
jgi:hypothetical protein